jgi:nucleoside-diphosphate-sugar epimerase
MTILITGASGFVGSRLAERLSKQYDVLCMSRSKPKSDVSYVKGTFDSFEDLRQLDEYKITSVIHLAAVTGGCSEEDGLTVNVLGTRRLIRYLLDRGCRKFVIASSIAAVGCLDPQFLPLSFPIADDHPCLATDAYGLSKAMVEDLTRYFSRIYADADFIHLRLGVVVPDETWSPTEVSLDTALTLPITQLTKVLASDVIKAIEKSLKSSEHKGVRVYNVVGPDATCDVPITAKLRVIFGDTALEAFDFSYYEQQGNAHKPLFTMDKIKEELEHESVMTTIPKKRMNSLKSK